MEKERKLPGNPIAYEQGPIRPPSEARSLLLRLTRNCPWNQCRFCPVYKKKKFSLRSIDEIKNDIEAARKIADEIIEISWKMGLGGEITDQVVSHTLTIHSDSEEYRNIAVWLYFGTGSCFLQDADNLIMKTDDLVDILTFLKGRFPEISRITTYSRSRTIARKSSESMKMIGRAGLNRIHIGLETGYDPLLKFMKKGVTAEQHIDAGRKVLDAGIELSEYVMPGLGGEEMWMDHAIGTARVLNQINPHFIRMRSLRVPERVPLSKELSEGSFFMLADDMVVEEIKLFIESLDGITSVVISDHIMNLLEEVEGTLPGDKLRMLEVIRRYQALSDTDRLIFRIGRRGGTYSSINDLENDPAVYLKIKRLLRDIEKHDGIDGVETFIDEMVNSYI
jgi:hypothetical protein